MKAHLAKVSLALLSAAFLLGCQEQGSDPVGPEGLGPEFTHKNGEHGKGGGGGGGGGKGGTGGRPGQFPVDVTVMGGIAAATQIMRFAENDELMGWTRRPDQPAPGGIMFQMNMTHTLAFALLGNCLEEGKRIGAAQGSGFVDDLFNKLVQPPLPLTEAGAFLVNVDKVELGRTSVDHNISFDNDLDGGPAEERWNMKVRGPPTVTVEDPDDGDVSGNFTVMFTGGTIRLKGTPTGKAPDLVFLTCDIQDGDEITFTVVRPS